MIGDYYVTIIWVNKFTFCHSNYNSWLEDQFFPVHFACDFSNAYIIPLSIGKSLFFTKYSSCSVGYNFK